MRGRARPCTLNVQRFVDTRLSCHLIISFSLFCPSTLLRRLSSRFWSLKSISERHGCWVRRSGVDVFSVPLYPKKVQCYGRRTLEFFSSNFGQSCLHGAPLVHRSTVMLGAGLGSVLFVEEITAIQKKKKKHFWQFSGYKIVATVWRRTTCH